MGAPRPHGALPSVLSVASATREDQRQLRAAIGVIFNPPDFEIEFDADGPPRAPACFGDSVSNNHFGHGHADVCGDLTSGHLGFYTAPPLSLRAWRSSPSTSCAESSGAAPDHRDERLRSTCTFRRWIGRSTASSTASLSPIRSGKVALRVHPGELKLLVGSQESNSGPRVAASRASIHAPDIAEAVAILAGPVE